MIHHASNVTRKTAEDSEGGAATYSESGTTASGETGRTIRSARARRLGAAAASLALVAGMIAAASLAALSAAPARAAVTALSTVTKSGVDQRNGSTADSSGKVGNAAPGDTIRWVLDYANRSTSSAQVIITDPISAGQTYVPGSLAVPAGVSPQHSADGTTWSSGAPVAGAKGVGATGAISPSDTTSSTPTSPTGVVFNTPGGDGYTVEDFNGNLYTVFHHNSTTTSVFCATLTNQVCPGWPANSSYVSTTAGTPLGQGTVTTATPVHNGSFISAGKLYWPAEKLSPTGAGGFPAYEVGLQCLDLTAVSSCGFARLDTVGTAPLGGSYGLIEGSGIPAANGRYYYFDASGNMLCFDPSTSAACGVTPVTSGQSVDISRIFTGTTYGQYAFAGYMTPAGESLACFDTATGAPCPAFPVAAGNVTTVAVTAPVFSPAGTLTGVCAVEAQMCWSLTGSPLPANPYSAHTILASGQYASGLALGTKYYTSAPANGQILCFDFASWDGAGPVPDCVGFTGPVNTKNYTVRALKSLPGCLAADGDEGRINVFNALTGEDCISASQSLVAAAPSYCDEAKHSFTWTTLTLNGLNGSEYAAATLTLADANGPLPGFTGLPLGPGKTSLDISSVPSTGPASSLSASITYTGVSDTTAVAASTFSLNRSGDTYSQICYSTRVDPLACATTAQITDQATAVTTVGSASDAPNGNRSGLVAFDASALPGSCPPSATTTTPAATAVTPQASPPGTPSPPPGTTEATLAYTGTIIQTLAPWTAGILGTGLLLLIVATRRRRNTETAAHTE
ncbi:hypothetical protein AB4068_15600 [Arthrobacter sp. 2RAF22]|uniref:hypothetical protein n=1 Tax=Arthrobacter sp. 2RAF22 TaxID=3232996 RepID=UPI003F9255C4